jgi:hypothetical protein
VDRLSADKGVLDEFLTRRKGDRVGLIVFGNAAFVQVPFTEDLDVCRQLLTEIARQRAEWVKREGGEGTGGQLSADAIVFTQGKNPGQQGGEQDTSAGGAMSDEELHDRWLRRVQTAPADFLRAKFAYQAAMQDSKP